MSNCNCHNEDLRDGSAQFSRYLKALDPSYAPIDDRSMEELLVFIENYAARIRFYDIPESELSLDEEVSWQEFFSRDMAVVLASASLTDVSGMKKNYEEVRDQLEETGAEEMLSKLFSASIDIAQKINDWFVKAIPENPLNNELKTAIQSSLGNQVQKIMAWEEGYRLVFVPEKMNLEYHDLEHNVLWGTDKETFADISIFEGTTPGEKVLNAALYADEVFYSFLGALNNLVDKSGIFLKYALEEYPGHQPHIALFISFLKLFSLAQKQLNELPERLLDYYYKDVLRLTPKSFLPDKVHIVFELTKEVMEYHLEKETALKAGKDDLGVEQLYMTEESLVVNQVKVKEIKTVYIEQEQSADGQNIKAVYANAVANSADGNGKPFDSDYTAWPTFGKYKKNSILPGDLCRAMEWLQPVEAERNPVQIGFAIASPQLLLQGGSRMLSVGSKNLAPLLEQINDQQIENALEIILTGESGWYRIVKEMPWSSINEIWDEEGKTFKEKALLINEPFYSFSSEDGNPKIVVFIPISAERMINFNAEIHKGKAFDTACPVLQILINSNFTIPGPVFNSVSSDQFSLEVNVGSMAITKNESGDSSPSMDGLKYLVLQNDEMILEAGKPFDPFTASPYKGKSFYIGSEEVFNKPLEALSINIRAATQRGVYFKLSILRNRQWINLPKDDKQNSFSIDELAENVLEKDISGLLYQRVQVKNLTDYNLNTTNGFIRLDLSDSLNSDFKPTKESLEMKEVSLNYRSELVQLEMGVESFFHVYPFGVAELTIPTSSNDNYSAGDTYVAGASGGRHELTLAVSPGIINNRRFNLLPQFTFTDLYKNATPGIRVSKSEEPQEDMKYRRILSAIEGMSDVHGRINQYSGRVQEEGILFIGLENAKPLQSISLLFQFAEGSAADEDHTPPEIHWSYLFHNQWVPMKAESIVGDKTYGFQTTGIIKFNLPEDITSTSTIVTNGLCWIRASVTEKAERIPRLINIYSQAVAAIFRDQGNSSTHYAQALKAESISKLQSPVAQISKVIQPFSSFGGKRAEIGLEFQTRVSERLRHKQRAITAWDYEQLILERFPEIFKIKCITHTDTNCLCREKQDENGVHTDCCGPQVAPGHVLLVPIANLKNRNAVNRLQPRTSQRVLIAISEYAKKFASPFVKTSAKNPVYEQVVVFFKVQFISGTDKGYFLKILNDAIVEFLSPWAFHEDADVVFGQKIYASSIIGFIEERPYVDFITDFEMGVCKEECCPEEKDMNTRDRTALESIKAFTNCRDVENVINKLNGFSGDIVVAPSTSRSLLVSAPRHFIFPYEAPPVFSICDQRKRKKLGTMEDNTLIYEDNLQPAVHPAGSGKVTKNKSDLFAGDTIKKEAEITSTDSEKKMEAAAVKKVKKTPEPKKTDPASAGNKSSATPVKKAETLITKNTDAVAPKKAVPAKEHTPVKKIKLSEKAQLKTPDNKDEVK